MYFSHPSYFPFSLSTVRLQKVLNIIRGTGNCPHFCHRQKPMFWLLLSKLLSVSQGVFKAAENCMGLFFPWQLPIWRYYEVSHLKNLVLTDCCNFNTVLLLRNTLFVWDSWKDHLLLDVEHFYSFLLVQFVTIIFLSVTDCYCCCYFSFF